KIDKHQCYQKDIKWSPGNRFSPPGKNTVEKAIGPMIIDLQKQPGIPLIECKPDSIPKIEGT
ncbi:hypothetical protein, partial [Parvimonas sp. D9]|uniref:hypothetical protein n=1 Tax=Parvimonas sp. D9 TaxID=3110689 RepID=UPI002B467CCC